MKFPITVFGIPIIGLFAGIYQIIVGFIVPESPVWKISNYDSTKNMQVVVDKFSKKLYKNVEISQHFMIQNNKNESFYFFNKIKFLDYKNLLNLIITKPYIKKLITIILIMILSNLVGIYGFIFNLNSIFIKAFNR